MRPNLHLRLEEPLRAKIEDAAKANGKSMNAEIVSRLEASFEKPDQPWAGGDFT